MRQSNSTFHDETRGASTFDAMMTRFSPRSRTNRLCVRCPRKGTSARGTTDAPVPKAARPVPRAAERDAWSGQVTKALDAEHRSDVTHIHWARRRFNSQSTSS